MGCLLFFYILSGYCRMFRDLLSNTICSAQIPLINLYSTVVL